MSEKENVKVQLSNQISKNIAEIAFFFHSTHGFPEEIFYNKINELKTLGDQMIFIENFRKEYPNILTPIKRYEPEVL